MSVTPKLIVAPDCHIRGSQQQLSLSGDHVPQPAAADPGVGL